MQVWELDSLAPPPHQPEVLRSDDSATRVIALTLPAGDELQEHQVHEHSWMLVARGEVDVTVDGDTRRLGSGAVLYFEPAERRRVQASSETLLLLLLSPWPGPGHPSAK